MISVCITTYNGAKYIHSQIDSIISQLSVNDEIIISDDGSTDGTLEIIKNFEDNRIKIFKHEKYNKICKFPFCKITKNVENALNHAIGDLIFLVDQDDIWLDEKLQTIKHEIGDDLCIIHDCIVVDENENELISSYYLLNNSKLGIIHNIVNSSYLGCCMAFKKELLVKALPFPFLPVPHDIWLGLIADWKGKMKMSKNKLLRYRRHGSNISSSSEKSKTSLIYKVHYRVNILLSLFIRMTLNK